MPQFTINPVTDPNAPVIVHGLYPTGTAGPFTYYQTGNYVAGTAGDGRAPTFDEQPGARKQINKRKRRAAARRKAAAAAAAAAAGSGTSAGGGTDTSGGGSSSDSGSSSGSSTPSTTNPLYADFKTPAQILEQARQLALLGAPKASYLRQLQAQQETGLQNLTTAGQNIMRGITSEQQAGLAGLAGIGADAYAAQQAATGSQLAAAGAAPTLAPSGSNEALRSQALNLSAGTLGYAPAIVSTGAQLVGASRGALTKALMDRSNQISADTAKYLTQLQNYEYQRAVAQETAKQNAAILGLKTQIAANDAAYKNARLSLAASAAASKAAGAAAKDQKSFASDLADLSLHAADYTSPTQTLRGNKYVITVREMGQTKQVTVYGNGPDEAKANSGYRPESIAGIQDLGPNYVTSPPTRAAAFGTLIPYIIQISSQAGTPWTIAKAKNWIRRYMPAVYNLP